VPLSEHEQRLLEQMERALYAEDPKFASSLRSAGPRPGVRRRTVIGVLSALVGVAVLVTGAATSIVAVGVLGFVLMLVGTFLVVSALRSTPAETSAATRPAAAAAAPKQKFMDRLDERFRRRQEGDDL
jgi:hypothetical protein